MAEIICDTCRWYIITTQLTKEQAQFFHKMQLYIDRRKCCIGDCNGDMYEKKMTD